ncbi:MAG: NUDIX hydrolase [Gammaproteobacteria bacterium]
MKWNPHVTVAAIGQHDDRFLMVEEKVRGKRVINNPAGHLEDAESFIEAVRRETREETGWEFEPDAVTGIYLWKNLNLRSTFLRIAFSGRCIRHHPDWPLDHGIVGPRWCTRAELDRDDVTLRSPLVTHCIDDHLAGRRLPLDILTCLEPSEIVLRAARA